MHHNALPLLIDPLINGFFGKEPIDMYEFRLPEPYQTPNRLRFAHLVDLLRRCQQRRHEYRMVGRCQVCTTCALVHDVEKKHTFLAVVLEFLQVLAFLMSGSLDFEILDLVIAQSFRDFLHQIRELNEEENTLILRNIFPRRR